MSDLISRSALIEILEDYENDDWNKNISAMLPSVVDDCIDFIENMPTAYSINKVVEELKQLKNKGSVTKSEKLITNACVNKAIKIVRQGGGGVDE